MHRVQRARVVTWLALHAEVVVEFARLSNHSDAFALMGWSMKWMQRTPLCNREPIECAGCGATFVPLHGLRLFCSALCKGKGLAMFRAHQKYALRRSAERRERRGHKRCANPRCGVEFEPRRSDAIYHSEACRVRANGNRAYERRKKANA